MQRVIKNTSQRTSCHCYYTIDELLDYLELDSEKTPYPLWYQSDFSFQVPCEYASLIKKRDWFDPILLQVLPRAEEQIGNRYFVNDPVGDIEASPVPGIIKKYKGRILLLATNECAIHCRFCFRRFFPFNSIPHTENQWDKVWDYIQQNTDIEEVILSGGDPLKLDRETLKCFFHNVAQNDHIKTLRIHTRIPLVMPSLISSKLIGLLEVFSRRFNLVFVVHANHPQELSEGVCNVLGTLKKTGAHLYNQHVLLKNINDDPIILSLLYKHLHLCGVVPYYIHQLDRASGTWHFEVTRSDGLKILKRLRTILPGYLVPRYVCEEKGGIYKTVLA